MPSKENNANTIFMFADGPLKVTISGPSSGAEGASVTLTCSADSRPEPDFVWFFNNQSTPLHNGSAYNFSAKNKGKYICKATNPLTNIVFYQSKTFSITGELLFLMCLLLVFRIDSLKVLIFIAVKTTPEVNDRYYKTAALSSYKCHYFSTQSHRRFSLILFFFPLTGHASVIHSPFQRDLMLMSVFAFIVPALFH